MKRSKKKKRKTKISLMSLHLGRYPFFSPVARILFFDHIKPKHRQEMGITSSADTEEADTTRREQDMSEPPSTPKQQTSPRDLESVGSLDNHERVPVRVFEQLVCDGDVDTTLETPGRPVMRVYCPEYDIIFSVDEGRMQAYRACGAALPPSEAANIESLWVKRAAQIILTQERVARGAEKFSRFLNSVKPPRAMPALFDGGGGEADIATPTTECEIK
jgi:hypothetical protein